MPLPTIILPGYFARAIEYQPLAGALNKQKIPTVVVPLHKRDWVPTLGGRSVVPILRAIDRTVKQMPQQYDSDRVAFEPCLTRGYIASSESKNTTICAFLLSFPVAFAATDSLFSIFEPKSAIADQ